MEALLRDQTNSTPLVKLDTSSRVYFIGGRSIPIDAELFYRPILNWLEEYSKREKVSSLQFCFRFEFFNIATSKRILFILHKLCLLQKNGTRVMVLWMYESSDDDMLEIGQDYAQMVEDLNFKFEEYNLGTVRKKKALKVG